ncbi:unnamed protein product, partial [Mesorhabditis belari]|uniref:Uncharacterized protein n=1 Tax=Mesorhabditis belari TaxID=2138241 RepID=A0AAF3EL51_9BILA
MSMVGLLCGRIFRFLQSFLGIFKRALCFLRKRDNNIGELPFTVAVQRSPSEDSLQYSQKPVDSWDSSWEQKAEVDGKIEQYRLEQEKQRTKSVEASDEPNFFDDMAPDIKKAKKVLLKTKRSGVHQSRNLFDFNNDGITALTTVCK